MVQDPVRTGVLYTVYRWSLCRTDTPPVGRKAKTKKIFCLFFFSPWKTWTLNSCHAASEPLAPSLVLSGFPKHVNFVLRFEIDKANFFFRVNNDEFRSHSIVLPFHHPIRAAQDTSRNYKSSPYLSSSSAWIVHRTETVVFLLFPNTSLSTGFSYL